MFLISSYMLLERYMLMNLFNKNHVFQKRMGSNFTKDQWHSLNQKHHMNFYVQSSATEIVIFRYMSPLTWAQTKGFPVLENC